MYKLSWSAETDPEGVEGTATERCGSEGPTFLKPKQELSD